VNARYVTPWSLPTLLKFGFKAAEEYRKTDNTVPYLLELHRPGGGTTGSWAAYPSQRVFNTQMGLIKALTVANLPQLASRSAISVLFREHPEYFVNNATVENYYTAFVANHRDFKQEVSGRLRHGQHPLGQTAVAGRRALGTDRNGLKGI
jgi:hypothetical protein